MRRVLVSLCALTLVFAACGDDDTTIFTTATTQPTAGTTAAPATTTVATTTSAPTATTAPPVSSTTAPAPTTTTTTVPVTVHPGFPSALSRSAIPIAEINQNWVAAIYSADEVSPYSDGPTALYLVSPGGDLYEVAAFEAGDGEAFDVGGISNDGTHIVVQTSVGFMSNVVSIDIATGVQSQVGSFESGTQIGTTLPTGRDVVVLHTTFSPTVENLDVFRTNGAVFAEIIDAPSAFPGIEWLYGLDGTYLIVGEPSGLNIYNNDGTLDGPLNTPPGYCAPVKWWDATTILARCVPQTVLDANGYYNVLWLIPTDGSAGQPLTAPPPPGWDVVEFGHADAWRVGGHIVLQWWGDCGARALQTRQSDGTGANIPVAGGGPWIHASVGNNLIISSIAGCGDPFGPVSLIGSDGSLVRTLVPQLAGYAGVISVGGMIATP
jgi:hypothetical protein